MKNNIKKARVKFREDVFSAFYAEFCLCPKLVIIITLRHFNKFVMNEINWKNVFIKYYAPNHYLQLKHHLNLTMAGRLKISDI